MPKQLASIILELLSNVKLHFSACPQNVNMPQYFPPMPQMNMTPLNQQINHNSMNSQINMQLNPQINDNKFIGLNNNMEISSNNTNREINSDNQINSMSDN